MAIRQFRYISALAILLLSACSVPPAPTPTPSPSATAQPSATPTHPPSANAAATETQAPTTLKLTPISKVYAAYRRIELGIETDAQFKNPFDPAEANIQVHFSGPNGQKLTTSAFWYQDYSPADGKPAGAPGWRARFTPTQSGAWSAQAELVSAKLSSAPVQINVGTAPEKQPHGFMRVNPKNPHYFAFEDGSTFFPIGINMGWGGAQHPLADYRLWLDHLAANQGNFIRVWMASWSFALEWKDTGLGNYSNRLYQAWMLDQVFQMAEERGIYIELVLINHGAFSATVNPEWDDNPYNVRNGGPCTQPQDFATNPEAQALFKRRLQYIAARWSYSPALMAWEWWNEEDLTLITNAQMVGWIGQMDPVLRGADPYHHLISTSYSGEPAYSVFSLAGIDFVQRHLYDSTDAAIGFKDIYNQLSQKIPGKPILFAEFGQSAGLEDQTSPDKTGLHLHNGLWAATFNGFASTAMYWWWDSYVEPLNLWGVYARLGQYQQSEDLATLISAHVTLSSRNVPAAALGSPERLLVWIHDRQNDTPGLETALTKLFIEGKKAGPDWVYLPQPTQGLQLTVYDLKDGAYTAYWYAPMQGKWLGKQAVQIAQGSAQLSVPTFTGDVALKLLPAAAAAPYAP